MPDSELDPSVRIRNARLRKSRIRDIGLYLVVAVVLVGSDLLALVSGTPIPSFPAIWRLTTTILVAGYLLHVFTGKTRQPRFWIIFVLLIAIHVLWVSAVPVVFAIIGLGIEFFGFAVLIDRLVSG